MVNPTNKTVDQLSSPLNLKSFKLKPLRAAIMTSCLGAGLQLISSSSAFAQDDQIEEIVISDSWSQGYRSNKTSMTKFTESLLDTPQSMTVLTSQLLDDRGSLTLNDALRNVPGITLGAGEFSWQGNNPSIRGFSSRNDMFLDGMRDFGNYYRDPFNLESVEVLQGPSSMVFGRGSTGGVINQSAKVAVPDPLRKLHINVGNADTQRLTADINQPLSVAGKDSAFRINLMKHDAEVAQRNGASSKHTGVAPTFTYGLGGRTQVTLSYLYQEGESTPDYGLPWISGRPADVDRETYYGFSSDYINTDTELSTIKVDHQINQNLSANAQLRYADYSRQTRITEPQTDSSVTSSTPQETVVINRVVFQGESTERMTQAQFNLVGDFTTGNLDHALVTGIEISEESSNPVFGFGVGIPSTTLLNPVEEDFSGTSVPRLRATTDAGSLAAYVMDTIKFNDSWQLLTGLRWDSFDTNYIAYRYDVNEVQTGSEQFIQKDIELSYRAALVYKPVDNATVYLGWGTSFNPSSEGLSFINSGRNLTIANANLDPEENESLELGAKWSLMNDSLFIDAALFHIEKSNARVPDPTTPGFNILAGKQVVDGLSVTLSGNLNEQVQISAGYTYLDSAQKETTSLTIPPDSPLQNVAENNLSLWLSYSPTNKLQFGGGARYVDERLATISLPTKSVPDYWSFDAMAKYRVNENLTLKVNLTNITDEYYFDQIHPWHVVPGPGFTSVFAINLDY